MARMVMTVRFGESLWDRLETFCARTGATKNGAVLIALEEFLQKDAHERRGVAAPVGAKVFRGPDPKGGA